MAEAAAELAEVAGGLLGEGKEFLTLLVHGKGSPGHRVLRRWDGKSVTHVLAHLLPMCPVYTGGSGWGQQTTARQIWDFVAHRTKWRLKNAVNLMLQGFKRGQNL